MTVLVLYDVFTPKRREKAQILTSTIRVRGMIHKDRSGNALNMQPWIMDFMGSQSVRGSMHEHVFVGYDYDEQEWLACVVDRATLPHIDLIDHRSVIVKPNATLADHAEAWAREHGETVPPRDTPGWTDMYARWIAYAFRP